MGHPPLAALDRSRLSSRHRAIVTPRGCQPAPCQGGGEADRWVEQPAQELPKKLCAAPVACVCLRVVESKQHNGCGLVR